jgi:hypothetical protein
VYRLGERLYQLVGCMAVPSVLVTNQFPEAPISISKPCMPIQLAAERLYEFPSRGYD